MIFIWKDYNLYSPQHLKDFTGWLSPLLPVDIRDVINAKQPEQNVLNFISRGSVPATNRYPCQLGCLYVGVGN